jgi:hypothetical protein
MRHRIRTMVTVFMVLWIGASTNFFQFEPPHRKSPTMKRRFRRYELGRVARPARRNRPVNRMFWIGFVARRQLRGQFYSR